VQQQPVVAADLVHDAAASAIGGEQAIGLAADPGDGEVGHADSFGSVSAGR